LMIFSEKSAIFDATVKVKGSLLKMSPGYDHVRKGRLLFVHSNEPYLI
jgi:hypothetical protein